MKVILYMLLVLYCAQAWGWGGDGHKIVARIAENHLTANAKKNINLLLDGDSLPSVSIWADFVKFTPLYSYTTEWHFINLPDSFRPTANTQYAEDNVVSAIIEMTKTVRDPLSSTGEKRRALKFLIHFVGDIHQPLHVGRGEDRGGNEVEVTYNGERMNLHELWDGELISEADLNYRQYAQKLEIYYSFTKNFSSPIFPFVDVITENLNARKAIYDFPAVNGGQIILDKQYLSKNIEFLNRSLYLGGMRLAALLNGLF